MRFPFSLCTENAIACVRALQTAQTKDEELRIKKLKLPVASWLVVGGSRSGRPRETETLALASSSGAIHETVTLKASLVLL